MEQYEHKICQALEGYRLELEKTLEDSARELYERLFMTTLCIAQHYKVCVDMYEHWWEPYATRRCLDQNSAKRLSDVVEDYLYAIDHAV